MSAQNITDVTSSNLIRKLRKKLRQIDKLERLEREFTEEEEEKVEAKDQLRADLQALLKEQEESMDALTRNVVNASVADGNEILTEKEKALVNFDQKTLGENVTVNDVGVKEQTHEENEEIAHENGVYEITVKEESPSNEKAEEVTEKREELVEAAQLNITRKSLRERKTKTSDVTATSTKTTSKPVSTKPDQLFQNMSFKSFVFEGHHEDVCAIDAYENFVVSGGRDTSLKLWIGSTQEELKSLGGHDATITGVLFIRDRPFSTYPNVVTSSYDCSLKVWNLEKGAIKKSIYVYSPVMCLDYSNGIAAIGTEGGKVELYNVESGEQIFTARAHENAVSAIKFLDDGKVVSGSTDGIIKIFDSKQSPDAVFTLDPAKIQIKQKVESNDASAVVKVPSLITSKINCIASWKDYVIYGDEGYNLKVLDYAKGTLTKVCNNLKEYCPTEALHVTTIQGGDYLFSVGADVDSGDGYVNVRSLPDLMYLGTIRDSVESSGIMTSICVQEIDSQLRLVTGGHQLRGWDQVVKRGRKRKSTMEDDSLIPCKFICNYTESKESEPESESEDEASSKASSKEQSQTSPTPIQSFCTIL